MAAATNKPVPTLGDVLKTMQEIQVVQKEHKTQFDELSKTVRRYTPGELFNDGNAPGVRRGESAVSSRGYSFLKMIGAMAKVIPYEDAKVEVDLANRLHKAYNEQGFIKAEANSLMAPFASSHMCDINKDLSREVRQVVKAGTDGYDAAEANHYRQKYWSREKALSWIDETSGGALVAPPMQGELIELLRNNEALLQAGARDVGMPPNGRIVFPRQTSAAQSYWVGESVNITPSQPGTGDLILSAKKLACLIKIPNELFRFSSISVEQFVREDIAMVMGLRLDKSLLEALGSNVEPKGLINFAGINPITASTTSGTGDTFQPNDVGAMIAAVEEVNATFKSWIMRPAMYSKIIHRRADAVVADDGKGPFMFNTWREVGDNMNQARGKSGMLEGYPVIKSTNVSKVRTKGGAANLSYILGGDFADYIIALGGVIEFVLSTQGDTPITQDQTWIRGIQYADGGPRHEASFVMCDTLKIA